MSKFSVKQSEGGADFKPLEAGTYVARCFGVVVTGTHDAEYQGRKYKRSLVRLQWELPDEMEDFGQGKLEPRVIGKKYTNSLGGGSKPSALRGHLEAWRGRPFTPEELKGFELTNLIGVPCILTVTNEAKQDGSGNYAAVAAVGKLMKGQTCPLAITKPVLYHVDELSEGSFATLPEWIQKEIQGSDEWKRKVAMAPNPSQPAQTATEYADDDDDDDDDGPPQDDIPF